MTQRKLEAIQIEARGRAFKVLKEYVTKRLPIGWHMKLAVGWGIGVSNGDGNCIYPTSIMKEKFEGVPKPVRQAIELAEWFEDNFLFGNEVIEGTHK